jgi:hypothetical protein
MRALCGCDAFGGDLVERPAERERLGLREAVGHQQVMVPAEVMMRARVPRWW